MTGLDAHGWQWRHGREFTQIDTNLAISLERINGLDRKYFGNYWLLVPPDSVSASNYCPLLIWRWDLITLDRLILINRAQNLLGVYQQGALIYWAPITRGRKLSYTLPGKFNIIAKSRMMRSRKYGNVPMPYSLQVFGNICIHQGPMVGRPASHGCIRLFRRDAIWLYNWTQLGTKVHIY